MTLDRAPRCYLCGKFTTGEHIYQPPTESWKLEPNDPEVICEKCLIADGGTTYQDIVDEEEEGGHEDTD